MNVTRDETRLQFIGEGIQEAFSLYGKHKHAHAARAADKTSPEPAVGATAAMGEAGGASAAGGAVEHKVQVCCTGSQLYS